MGEGEQNVAALATRMPLRCCRWGAISKAVEGPSDERGRAPATRRAIRREPVVGTLAEIESVERDGAAAARAPSCTPRDPDARRAGALQHSTRSRRSPTIRAGLREGALAGSIHIGRPSRVL